MFDDNGHDVTPLPLLDNSVSRKTQGGLNESSAGTVRVGLYVVPLTFKCSSLPICLKRQFTKREQSLPVLLEEVHLHG